MAIPILRRVTPFSATEDFTFTFNISGVSQQIFANKLEIKLSSDTSKVVYSEKIQEFRYQHTVPANTLVNGEQYVAKLQIFNSLGDTLGESDPIFFYCLSPPVLKIPTIVNGEVGNQTVLFQGSYSQSEGEILQSYQFILYNDNQDIIATSPEIFDSNIQYEFSELENRQKYYIELKITTINELGGTTGLIEFTPRYIAPKFESAIELTNLPGEASVFIKCNVIRIIGKSDIEPVKYEEDGSVNLINNGVWFDEGFKLKENWTIQMWTRDIVDGSTFFKLVANDGSHLKLIYEDNKINMYKMLNDKYVMQTLLGDMEINSKNQTIFICIKHVNGLYDFTYKVVS